MPTYRTKLVAGERRNFLIAPITLVIANVVNLNNRLFPPEVLRDCRTKWKGRKILLNHPTDWDDVDYIVANYLGHLGHTVYHSSQLISTGWFDVERTMRIAPVIYRKLCHHEAIEVSAGYQHSSTTTVHNGKPVDVMSKVYPHHIALLTGTPPGFTLEHGVGVNNCRRTATN